ncbi:LOW QUALITY PROTEIN: conserved hypothetical protein, partial [Streptomyces viridosporus ATCC 14672]
CLIRVPTWRAVRVWPPMVPSPPPWPCAVIAPCANSWTRPCRSGPASGEVGPDGGRRHPGLREAGAPHRSGEATRARPVHGEPVRAARLLPVRRRRHRRTGLRGLEGTRRAHHDDELGARGGTRGLPPDVPLEGAARCDAPARGVGRRRTGRRLLGRRTAGAPPDRGPPTVLGEHRAVPGVHPAEPAPVAGRSGPSGRRGRRPGLRPGGGEPGSRDLVHERAGAPALRRALREHPHRRPAPLLRGLRPRALLPLRTVPGRGRLLRPASGLRPLLHRHLPGELAGHRSGRLPEGGPGRPLRAGARLRGGRAPHGNPAGGRGDHRPARAGRRRGVGLPPHLPEPEQAGPVPAGGDPPARLEGRPLPGL